MPKISRFRNLPKIFRTAARPMMTNQVFKFEVKKGDSGLQIAIYRCDLERHGITVTGDK